MPARFAAAVLAVLSLLCASAAIAAPIKNIVLVHGAWADGSGWQGVYKILVKHGYKVSVLQEPNNSLAEDVTAAKRLIDQQDGPVILVGHSYGGALITEAGNDTKVVGLVYIAAFQPDAGESLASILQKSPPGAPPVPALAPVDGYIWLDQTKYPTQFAGDVDHDTAVFMANAQVPFGAAIFTTAITDPAWKKKPSWYLVAGGDQMIPPDLQRMMSKRAKATVAEVKGASHCVYVSHPKETAALIEKAAVAAKAN